MIHLDISGREAVFFTAGMVATHLMRIALSPCEEVKTWEEQESARKRERTRSQRQYDAP